MRRGALPGGGREAHALRYVRLVSLPSDRAHLRRLEGAVVRDHGRPSPVRGVQGLTSLTAPTLQLLAWIAERETCGYAETIEARRSSCPRPTVLEDAVADGLVRVERRRVLLAAAGAEALRRMDAP